MACTRSGRISVLEFTAALRHARLSLDQKFGVAVSGEAKSLALLLLLKETVGKEKLVAFTVDHKLCPDTDKEAAKLHAKITELGITHHIVNVDWSKSGSGVLGDTLDPPQTLEKLTQKPYYRLMHLARPRRYAVLADACKEHGIQTLFAGYNLDDQVRTTLHRLDMSSGINGLAGIRTVQSELPAVTSLSAKTVRLVSPLLNFPKERLEATLRESQAQWDDANPLRLQHKTSYPTLVENAERLNCALGNKSPVLGLSRESMAVFCSHMEKHRKALKKKTLPIIDEFTLRDPPTGTCFMQVNSTRKHLKHHWISQPHLAESVISELANWTTTSFTRVHTSFYQDVRQAILRWYRPRDKSASRVMAADVMLYHPRASQTGAFIWMLTRAPMSRSKTSKGSHVEIQIGQSALWDNRFMFSLTNPEGATDGRTLLGTPINDLVFVIRPFLEQDYHNIMARMQREATGGEWNTHIQKALAHYWKKMPPRSRETIPCVALKQDGKDTSHVVAVPSVGVMLEPNLVDIKFTFLKQVSHERAKHEQGFELLPDLPEQESQRTS
ncbi:hypothetical protein HDU85_003107 [Gaertneriomyces sp. JEL0708]|nr:hypothetical protein HDU85_003107 [Gaertneriomyces sp. JEL0708]